MPLLLQISTSTTPRRRGAGWGIPACFGLRGGADTLSNGTTGWGPPPAGGGAGAAGAGAAGGWGAAPPPSASASAAWGNPNASDDNGGAAAAGNGPAAGGAGANGAAAAAMKTQQPQQPGQPQVNQQGQAAPNSSSGSQSSGGASTSGSSAQTPSSSSAQPPQGASSWAAAAGKGLPPSSDSGGSSNGNGGSSSANKQLEHLNSVREALFSQDGWGGSNVKQDTAWDVDARNGGGGGGGDGAGAMGAGAQAAPKDPSMWGGGPRNDGTDLWRSTLSGQPPAPKPQPANPWGHTPQNPTDYKQWGEEDDGTGGDPGNSWRPDHPPGPYNSKRMSFISFSLFIFRFKTRQRAILLILPFFNFFQASPMMDGSRTADPTCPTPGTAICPAVEAEAAWAAAAT